MVFIRQYVRWDTEQIAQPLVLHQLPATAVHYEEAVDGGVGLSFQKRALEAQFSFRLFAARDITKKAVRIAHSIFFVRTHRTVENPYPDSIFSVDAIFLIKWNLFLKKRSIG